MTVNTDMTGPSWEDEFTSFCANGACVETRWTKGCASGSCVEIHVDGPCGYVEVRDSKNPFGSVLRYTTAEWRELTGQVLSTGKIPYVVDTDGFRVWIGKDADGEYRVLIFDGEEIAAFVAAVFAGKFRMITDPSTENVKAGV